MKQKDIIRVKGLIRKAKSEEELDKLDNFIQEQSDLEFLDKLELENTLDDKRKNLTKGKGLSGFFDNIGSGFR